VLTKIEAAEMNLTSTINFYMPSPAQECHQQHQQHHQTANPFGYVASGSQERDCPSTSRISNKKPVAEPRISGNKLPVRTDTQQALKEALFEQTREPGSSGKRSGRRHEKTKLELKNKENEQLKNENLHLKQMLMQMMK